MDKKTKTLAAILAYRLLKELYSSTEEKIDLELDLSELTKIPLLELRARIYPTLQSATQTVPLLEYKPNQNLQKVWLQ